jgi:dTDP-4-amino-4,6-dideoxygalactose transaminase
MASHLEAPYAGCGTDLTRTEKTATHTLQLPLHRDLTDADVDYVIERICALACQ